MRASESPEAIQKSTDSKTELREMLDRYTHDLRSPLTAIKAAANLLRHAGDRLDADTRQELIITIDDEASRLNNNIEKLLWIARLELGDVEAVFTTERLLSVFERVAGRIASRLQHHQLNLAIESALTVTADRRLLEYVLESLLDNAVKFSPAGSTVRVSANHSNDQILITIIDDGGLLAPDDCELIFDKLNRSSSITTQPRGSGMSLAICRAILHLHNGRIWAETEPGKSTRFYIALPTERHY